MNVVPSPATKTLAQTMIDAARHEDGSGGDAVLAYFARVRPEQRIALVAHLLDRAAATADPVQKAVVLSVRDPKACSNCGKRPINYLKRGMCASCYQRAHKNGELANHPRHMDGRRDEVTRMIELGADLETAASALGLSPDALYRWCLRSDMRDAYKTLRARTNARRDGAA